MDITTCLTALLLHYYLSYSIAITLLPVLQHCYYITTCLTALLLYYYLSYSIAITLLF